MKNKEAWTPSKFVMTKRGLRASKNRKEISISSRFIGDIQARVYEKAIKEHARGLLLDLGCGKVPLYETYKEYVSDNVCIDWENSLHKNPFVDHQMDLNKEIPLPDRQFDTVLMTDVLEHISNPGRLMSEVTRLLKAGGKLIATVPFLYWIHEKPFDYYRYTEFQLRIFCEENKLEVDYLEPYGGAPEVLVDIVAKQLSSSRLLSLAYYHMSKIVALLPPFKKVSRKSSKNFPLGYCLIARKKSWQGKSKDQPSALL